MFRINDIFRSGGVLSKTNPSYKERPSQIEAASQIEFALRNQQHFILEGPCGFGKSLSYLIPAMKNLIESDYDGQIVVVTSNISLQDQLFDKDIPYVLNIMDEIYPNKGVKDNIHPALLKGINNFICMDKIESDDFLNNINLLNTPKMMEVQKFYATTKDGDLTKASFLLNSDEKKIVTCPSSNDCKSNLCSSKSECFYNLQKLKAKMSKLVVTNYHMLFSCKSSYSSLFDDASVIIFDEAHEAEAILRDFEANSIGSGTVEYIERKITEIKNGLGPTYSKTVDFDVERLKEASNRFFTDIQLTYKDKIIYSPQLVKNQSDLPDPEDFNICLSRIVKSLDKVELAIEQTITTISENDEDDKVANVYDVEEERSDEEGLDSVLSSIKNTLVVIKALKKTCENVIYLITSVDSILSDSNLVMYVESARNRTILGVKDISISSKFKKYFLDDEEVTCILTSATISVNNSFEYLKRKLGLNQVDYRVMEYVGETPFDLTNQELWYIPENALPANDKDFDAQVPGQIEEIIKASNGGALCLFTSNKNLNSCKEQFAETMVDYTILAQGDSSKAKLLEDFRNDFNASLLATKSFFTGVDVAGQSLRCVVIDKLPFSSPFDPINQKLSSERNYFRDYMLPEMIIAFKQAVGRGVRSVDDKCVICILDERILTANYSSVILGSLNYEKMSSRDPRAITYFLSRGNE